MPPGIRSITVSFSLLAVLLSISCARLERGAPALSGTDSITTETLIYKTIGERKLTLDVTYPPRWKPSDKRPAIVFFFGGGWSGGETTQFRPQAEYFAARGLVCARADYRVKSRDGVKPDSCVADALSAMRWVRSHAGTLGVDPVRIVASGGSAGGHLAACTYFAEGPNDPKDDLSVSPRPNAMILYNPALDMTDKNKFGLSETTALQISPLKHLRREAPPVLLIDGTKDFLRPEIEEFTTTSLALGARAELEFYEGQGHGFFNRPPYLAQTTERADRFLQSIGWLGAKPRAALPVKNYMKEGTR